MADFGEILRNIGEFGLFQKVTLVALCFTNITQAFVLASFLFIETNPDRHCNTDWILGLDPNLTTDEQLNLTLPREADGTFSRCQMFVPVDWDIDAIREFGLNKTMSCQNGWVYKSTLYKATIVTDFNLVCDKANLVEIIQAVYMVGVLTGFIIMFTFVLTTGFLMKYKTLQCHYLSGLLVSFLSATEWIGVSKRSLGVCMTRLFASIGQCALAGVIYLIRDWRLAQIVTAVPLAVILIYIWFIPESARWLLNRGRTEEAKQLIMKAAAINKRTVPDSLLDNVLKYFECLIKFGHVLTVLFLFSNRFSVNVLFFCLYFNMANLGLNVFLTQFIFGAVEIPAHILCIWLSEVFGRKPLFILTLLTAGLSSILILAVPQGKCQNVCFQFPTALSLISARTGGIVAPLLNITAMYHWIIPILVSSSLTFISGGLGFMLPETRRRELPDSIDEAEGNREVTVKDHTGSAVVDWVWKMSFVSP
uniref:Solute carrier family 22 member 13-like n=1 Tax=Sphaeramia orbicularis TaxID=375764 RepID=A0A673B2V2_9TELE